MLRLQPAREPVWLDIAPGVRFQVRPVTTADMMLAARATRSLPEGASIDDSNLAYTIAVAERTVLDWDGIGDAAGEPIKASRENIAALLRQSFPVYQSFDIQHVLPALATDEAKNVSSASLNGTSAAGRRTARRAAKPAPPAPTPSRTRKPRTKPSSGK